MTTFSTKELGPEPDVLAPDGAQVRPGMALTIPLGTVFQFRADPTTSLGAVAITMPPWPGEDEADLRTSPWMPTG